MRTRIAKIVSGGQTGADRGGLDAAIETNLPHGGWCPKGRRAEDGAIPECYRLSETDSPNYLDRTERNVVDSQCTVVFTRGPAKGGSKKTIDFARKHGRPWLHVDLSACESDDDVAKRVAGWLEDTGGGLIMVPRPASQVPPPNPVLNVAGSRESKCPGIQERVKNILEVVFDHPWYTPCSE